MGFVISLTLIIDRVKFKCKYVWMTYIEQSMICILRISCKSAATRLLLFRFFFLLSCFCCCCSLVWFWCTYHHYCFFFRVLFMNAHSPWLYNHFYDTQLHFLCCSSIHPFFLLLWTKYVWEIHLFNSIWALCLCLHHAQGNSTQQNKTITKLRLWFDISPVHVSVALVVLLWIIDIAWMF